VKLRVERHEPKRPYPRKLKALPNSTQFITERVDENFASALSPSDTYDPRRTKERVDNELPKDIKSQAEKADPHRAKDRKEKDEPICKQSKTDMLPARRSEIPATDRAEPILAYCRIEQEELKETKSKTDAADPPRTKERKETVEPICKKLNTEAEDPIRVNERMETEEPTCKKPRADIIFPRACITQETEDPRRVN
jgi:hypothetical protein